jgi:hypothetical protein
MPPKDLSLIFKSTLFCRYGKSSQSPENRYDYQKKAVNRCSPRSDSGRTKGYEAKQQTFCLHFARGVCVEGYNCMYLHHLPTGVDDARNNMEQVVTFGNVARFSFISAVHLNLVVKSFDKCFHILLVSGAPSKIFT